MRAGGDDIILLSRRMSETNKKISNTSKHNVIQLSRQVPDKRRVRREVILSTMT